jgi:hypothetical protein
MGCDEHDDSHEQHQNRMPLRREFKNNVVATPRIPSRRKLFFNKSLKPLRKPPNTSLSLRVQ